MYHYSVTKAKKPQAQTGERKQAMKKFLIFFAIILIILIIWSSVTVREYDATIERVDKKIELTEGGR